MDGFMKEFVTPILKVFRRSDNKAIEDFFTIPEYEHWAHGKNLKLYRVKYYKGLGTSTTKEAKEYFKSLADHKIDFQYIDGKDDDDIDLAFNKKKADKRKEWLTTYDPAVTFVDHSISELRYSDFINKELILFSIADCARSIPSVCDGLKPGQRKILFSCFKKNLKNEIKVAQLSGYVSEHSAYHHGEVSL
jgi:DNA topoisomerase-2